MRRRKPFIKKDGLFDSSHEKVVKALLEHQRQRLAPIPGQAGELLKAFGIHNVGDLENELLQLARETSSPEDAAKLLSQRLVEKATKKTRN